MFSLKTLRPPVQGSGTSVELFSSSNSYLVEQIVGQGTFGTVAKCKRLSDMKTVAIKMMKDKDDNRHQTRAEAKSLQRLSTLDSDKSNTVQWHGAFVDRGYFCLEFESLDRSLHDFMVERKFKPLLLKEVRPIVQQITNALCHLKGLNMIHADLKLQNVMLVNHAHEPFKIKVIDFGLACDSSSARLGSCIQTLPYRSPEVMLGLPFTEAVDMWSVGCIAAYLYLGSLLYAGHSEYDIMRCIVETQGQLPDSLLSQGQRTHRFFDKVGKPPNKWKFKSPVEAWKSTGEPPVDIRAFKLKSLEEILTAREISSHDHADRAAEMADLKKFIGMLKGMLHQEESMRLKPHQALNHPFIRMGHLRCKFSSTSYFKSSTKIMAVCNFTPAVNAKATKPSQNPPAVGECPQQSLPGPAYPVLQCPPASLPAAVPNKRDQQHIHPHPCTNIQSTSNVKSGIKRKADDGDLNLTETPRQSKCARHEHRVQSCEGTVAVCRNNTSASVSAGVCPQQSLPGTANPVRKCLPASLPAAVPNKQDQQHIHPHPCTDIQSTSGVKSGTKRKADDGDLNLTETPRQSKCAKHEHRVQSCEEKVAVCRNNTSAFVSAGVCPQQSLPGTAKPVQKCLPASLPSAVTDKQDQQHIHPHPCTNIQSTSDIKSGIKRKADDGDLNLTETPRQSKCAKHEHRVQSCEEKVAVCRNNTSAFVSAGVCPQQSLPGTAKPVQKCLPASLPSAVTDKQDQQHIHPHPCTNIQSTSDIKSGIKRKADDGDLNLTETPRQSKCAKHEHRVQSCEETVAVCRNNTSAFVSAGVCPQQSLPGTANPVRKCLPASLPAAVPNKQDQQHIHPHPCTNIQSTSDIKSGIKRKADDGDLNLTETPRQSKCAKHEHRVQSCEETVAVCRNNTSAFVSAGVCPQQPRSASVYPVPQYLPAVVGFQQKPQSGTTIPVQQCWPSVRGCQQQPLYGPTIPVQQYWPAVRVCPQQPQSITTAVLHYWPALGGFLLQPLSGITVPVQLYTSSFLPAVVAYNLDQQHISPHPHI